VIAEIGRSSFHHAFSSQFRLREDLDHYLDYTYSSEKIRRSLCKRNNVYLLAMVRGQAIGFAKLKKYSLHPQISSVWQAELQKIYILPEWQGCGAGNELINAVIRLANEIQPEYLWLDVLVSNVKARKLYEKVGFRRHGFHSFTIGSQVFEYDVLKIPVALPVAV
jgi:ribosomal protein S18 acetylase RimI-like enzyme